MRADSRSQPPSFRTSIPRGCGQPKYYSFDQYMQVWLFVQEVMVRNKWSTNRVCLTQDFGWFAGSRSGLQLSYSVKRATLRSLYQRAVRILKEEREERDGFLHALQLAKCSSPRAAEPLEIAAWWNGELQRRLAKTN